MSKMRNIENSIPEDLVKKAFFGKESAMDSLVKAYVESIKDEIQFGEVTETYLHKYTTKKLNDMLSKMVNDDIDIMDEPNGREIFLNIFTLFNQRQREYQLLTGDYSKISPEDVDRVLFPQKQIPKVNTETKFQIDSWDELYIQLHPNSKNQITFMKMFNGQPSLDSRDRKELKDLHLGSVTMKIINNFGYLPYGTPYRYEGNRDNLLRVNKHLKKRYKMDSNPITTRDGMIRTPIHVKVYDAFSNPVIHSHMHHGGTSVDEDKIQSHDEKEYDGLHSEYDEENPSYKI
jgi:hypothetical protein